MYSTVVRYVRHTLWSDKTIIHVLPSGAMTTNWGRVQLSMTGIVWCRCEQISAVKFIICRAWSVKTLLVYSEFSSKACGRTRNLINTDLLNVPSQGFSIFFFLLHLNCSNSNFHSHCMRPCVHIHRDRSG